MPSPSPELHEPDLPRTAAEVTKGMRTGWTTGTCSAAATKAAALALVTGSMPTSVEIALPRTGKLVTFSAVTQGGDHTGVGTVVKDAGDDPDVTHGAELVARVTMIDGDEVRLVGGAGVGTVTKPGLGLEVGGPAINPVPRSQITAAVRDVIPEGGVEVEVSVPGGARLAKKTTNPRLGILEGISILGTTGIVRPFSTAAWRASVGQAIDVIAAQGGDAVVLTTGGRTERAAMTLCPTFEQVQFVEVGDFTGYAIRRAVSRGLGRVVFVGMAGKLAKLAAGVMMTHWTKSRVDPDILACLTAESGGSDALVSEIATANTARHAYDMWTAAGLDAAFDLLCRKVADNLVRFSGDRISIEVVMVDFETLEPVGRAAA